MAFLKNQHLLLCTPTHSRLCFGGDPQNIRESRAPKFKGFPFFHPSTRLFSPSLFFHPQNLFLFTLKGPFFSALFGTLFFTRLKHCFHPAPFRFHPVPCFLHPSHWFLTLHPFFFRKQSYTGVVFTRFCGLRLFRVVLKMFVVLQNVSSKNVDL